MKKLCGILALLLGVTFLASCANNSSGDAQKASDGQAVVIATQGADTDIIARTAVSQGMFARHGIVPDLVGVNGGGPAAAGLASGSITVIAQSPAFAVQSSQSGTRLRLFCGAKNQLALAVVAKPGSTFDQLAAGGDWKRKVAAWKGTTIGVPALGGAIQIWLQQVAQAAGVDKSGLTFVAVGLGQSATSALQTGRVDLVATSPFAQQVMVAQDYPVVFDFSTDGVAAIGQQAQGGYLASEAWLEKNPELANAFCDAIGDAVGYLRDPANRTTISAMLSKDFGVSEGAIPQAVEAVSHYSTDLSCGPIDKALASAVAGGVLTQAPTCRELVWSP
ncbi:hypothetical protein GCM10009836_25310 [Pseudonocardia ailaonensis]|uniref:SsuA/THI5-like domain-containing protein n=1 Tax=Pseudonocardia ailaonensis TaxID=367279 RepID=A0ABN2MYT2_9PSEU